MKKENFEQDTPLPLKHTPSLIFNNLDYGVGSEAPVLAYIHRHEVYLVTPKKASDQSSECMASIAMVPKSDVAPVYTAKLCSFGSGVNLIVLATQKGVEFWNLTKKALVHFADNGHAKDERIFSRGIASFQSGSRNYVVAGDSMGTVTVFEVDSTGSSVTEIKRIPGCHKEAITCVCGGPTFFVTADGAGTIKIWDDKFEDKSITNTGDVCTSVAAVGSGTTVAASFASGHIRLFDVCSGKIIVEIAAHTRMINAIAYDAKGNLLASASEDSYICLWRLPVDGETDVSLVHSESIKDALWTGVALDGSTVVAAAYETPCLYKWTYLSA